MCSLLVARDLGSRQRRHTSVVLHVSSVPPGVVGSHPCSRGRRLRTSKGQVTGRAQGVPGPSDGAGPWGTLVPRGCRRSPPPPEILSVPASQQGMSWLTSGLGVWQGKTMDFVDVNESNARWVQDFRLKAYASPAKLESIDGEGPGPGHGGCGGSRWVCGPQSSFPLLLGLPEACCPAPWQPRPPPALSPGPRALPRPPPSPSGGRSGGHLEVQGQDGAWASAGVGEVSKGGGWRQGPRTDRPVAAPRCPVPRPPDPQLSRGPG